MTEKELKKKLSKYSKEVIIDTILNQRNRFFVDRIIAEIEFYDNKKKREKEEKAFDTSFDEYLSASSKYIKFQKEMFKKHGDSFRITQLTNEEKQEYINLANDLEIKSRKFDAKIGKRIKDI